MRRACRALLAVALLAGCALFPLNVEVNEAEYFAGWKDGYDEWYRLIGSMGMGR
jgi:hypothetical protein